MFLAAEEEKGHSENKERFPHVSIVGNDKEAAMELCSARYWTEGQGEKCYVSSGVPTTGAQNPHTHNAKNAAPAKEQQRSALVSQASAALPAKAGGGLWKMSAR